MSSTPCILILTSKHGHRWWFTISFIGTPCKFWNFLNGVEIQQTKSMYFLLKTHIVHSYTRIYCNYVCNTYNIYTALSFSSMEMTYLWNTQILDSIKLNNSIHFPKCRQSILIPHVHKIQSHLITSIFTEESQQFSAHNFHSSNGKAIFSYTETKYYRL